MHAVRHKFVGVLLTWRHKEDLPLVGEAVTAYLIGQSLLHVLAICSVVYI